MKADDVWYGGSLSYRFMCRYNSGFVGRHPLLDQFRYYWRIEPGVHFSCNLAFDPFAFMVEHGKRYAFVITLEEIPATVPTLWNTTMDWVQGNPDKLANDNHLSLFMRESGTYNLCHYWCDCLALLVMYNDNVCAHEQIM